ncbi:hypothetical protein [Turicibacter sanguinis]|uniref:hypothetical protein n=1 Tax=Turicibacter sanguinis TaxID=154288 RepID=UPI0021D4A336|nr:hypothetical protein [Turicibacter sanguinis]MCU7196946.1 hypothetical protein [Turicibacter sanguinis]
MELLKPKREETVKQEYEVLKPTRFIFDSYSKYTKYTEGEILDHLALQVLKEDHEFVKWVSKQRTNKKFFQHGLLHHLSEEQKQLFEPYPEEETLDESDEEICI